MEVLKTARGPLEARIEVPGSKSIVNRALICAALAEGESVLVRTAPGEDTEAMISCLTALGVGIRREKADLSVIGCGGNIRGGVSVSARLAGTTSRFVIALAALAAEPTVVTGDEALRRRPFGPLREALVNLGAEVAVLDPPHELPVRVSRKNLSGGAVSIRGDVSSQFVSALMLIGPLLPGGLRIELTSPLVSAPYLRITAQVMAAFGIPGVGISESEIEVPAGRYRACRYTVEPDASSASYPLAAAGICGGQVLVTDLGREALQGDIGFLDVLTSMGCEVSTTPEGVSVRGAKRLVGGCFDLRDMSDLVPTVAALAVFADGTTEITGVGFIRHKESDRIGDLVAGLRRVGCQAEETEDGLVIHPSDLADLHGAQLACHHDHRLAMAWSLLALRIPGIEVDDPDVVAKSWPEWWSVRDRLIASPATPGD